MRESLRTPGLVFALVLAASGCAGGTAPLGVATAAGPQVPASPGSSPAPLDPAGIRWSARPVPVPPAFQAAIVAGTRTSVGTPGPNYWTQRVDYRIEAELDPETARLTGSEVITYRNESPTAVGLVILHLYQNLFSEGVERTRQVSVTGGIAVGRVAVNGREFQRSPTRQAGAYIVQGTLMGVYFEDPIPPNGSIELEVDWNFEVPPQGAPRQGHIENRLFNVAQWYPQVAVFDDLRGWDTWPYLGNGEFYLEYGDFDVSLTLPEGWLVGASGTLQNPEEVLTETVRSRLATALQSDEVVHIVTEAERGAGTATLSEPDGTLTWRFQANGVRDFAFAASGDYLWDATRAFSPDADGDGAAEIVEVHSFYRPETESWTESAEYIQHALTFHAERWHPYPWPQMTGAEGPVGGMEYPMLTFVAAFPQARDVYETLNHEIGHMWFPMMVGSNEASYPWMDEGLTTYIEAYATGDFFGEPDSWRQNQDAYTNVAGADFETPIMRHADLHGPTGTYGEAAYWKPATLLRALEGLIGREAVWEALQRYNSAWIYGHPDPMDFFNAVEAVAGRDLDWFWHPFWYETATLDQAVEAVEMVSTPSGSRGVRVTIADLGDAPMPAIVEVGITGGALRETIPVEVWLQGVRRHELYFELPADAALERVEVDPEGIFPDADRTNNAWER